MGPEDRGRFDYWLGQKYTALREHSAADLMRAQTDASTLPGLREAQGFNLRGEGQLRIEQAGDINVRRQMDPTGLGGIYEVLVNRGFLPPAIPGTGVPKPAETPETGATSTGPAPPVEPVRPEVKWLTMPPLQQQQQQLPPVNPAVPAVPSTAPPAAPVPGGATSIPQPRLPTPEELTAGARNAATRRRQQFGFRRGIANVQPQGYQEGTADVRDPLYPRLFIGAMPGVSGGAPGAMGQIPGPTAPGPGPSPGGGGRPFPYPTPPDTRFPPVPQLPAPLPTPYQPRDTWPGGQPRGFNYDPNAGYGVENMGGVIDYGTRIFNPEQFNAAVQRMPLSENIEDRRTYDPTMPMTRYDAVRGFIDNMLSRAGTIFQPPPPAPRGSLPDQAGVNDIGRTLPIPPEGPVPRSAPPPAPPRAPAPAPQRTPEQIGGDYPGFKKGSANVKGKGKNGKAPKGDSPPKGLEALLPILMAMQGGGGGGPPAGPPMGAPPAQGFKKGSANVKSKGGKSKSSGGSPEGLEALLAAMQGAGAVGPQAGPAMPPAMGGGAAAPPGFAYGMSDVQFTPPAVPPLMSMAAPPEPADTRYAKGTRDVGGANPGRNYEHPPAPPLVLPDGTVLHAEPPVDARGWFERNIPWQDRRRWLDENYRPGQYYQDPYSHGGPLTPQQAPAGHAAGTPSVGYPYGVNEVPGAGTGKIDTVPAMLAPHEAVLNRAAADILGRGLIAALNSQGMKQMGMRRGAAT